MLKRKLPKYEGGGFLDNLNNNSGDIGTAGMMAGNMIGSMDAADGEMSDFGSFMSQGLNFGSMGLQIGAGLGGPLGAAIGGGIGLLGGGIHGLLSNRKQKEEQTLAELEMDQARKNVLLQNHAANSKTILDSYDKLGISRAGYYKKGGYPKGSYLAEEGEIIEHNKPAMVHKSGGLKRISSNTSRITGDSHNDPSGGVEMSGGDFIYSDAIELPESFDLSI